MEININLKMPDPGGVKSSEESLYDKVCEFIACCEDYDIDSDYHWTYLKALYIGLKNKPVLNSEAIKILAKLTEFFDKHNQLSSDNQYVPMDGKDFWINSPKTGK